MLNFKQASHLSFNAKSKDSAEIIIYGVIGGGGLFEDGIDDKTFQKQLKDLGSVKDLTIRINSPGGDVFQGWAIYNLIRDYAQKNKTKVTVIVDGIAASIASIIALSGSEIVMGEGSQIMIHSAWTFTMGNARDLEAVINRLYAIDEQLVKTYAQKTGKDKEYIRQLVEAETWFTADEAIDIGFANKKIEDQSAIAASFLGNFAAMGLKRVPKTLKTEDEVKNQGLKVKIEELLARTKHVAASKTK